MRATTRLASAATPTPAASYSPQEQRRRIGAIVAASSGNLVEWFDFYIYAFCAIYLDRKSVV